MEQWYMSEYMYTYMEILSVEYLNGAHEHFGIESFLSENQAVIIW